MDPDEGLFGAEYSACIEAVKREYITATAVASMFGCILMGLFANLPIALAPGMGMNAFFTYSVVGFRGLDDISFEAAVTAVMIEGAIFFVMAITGARYAIVRLIPEPVRVATPAAIGAFLAHLGLQTAEGIGVVVSDIATAVTLGGCPESMRTPIVALTDSCRANTDLCTTSDAYTCDDLGGVMTAGTTWVGVLGLLIIIIMLSYKNKAAFVVGIATITFLSWFRGTAITYFPDTLEGNDRFDYFKKVVSVEKIDLLFANFTSDLSDVTVALITFLYVDFLDTSGTLLGLVSAMGYVNEEGDFPRSKQAFAVDAAATMFGSIFGLSPVTSYIESGAGVEAGSRTGLTAIIVGFFFFLSIFFAPIIASIPPWAIGGALIVVGALMARSLRFVKWHDPAHAATAFLTVVVMPLTYSIAYGLIAGIGCWIVLQGTFYLLALVGVKRPSFALDEDIVPKETENKDTDDENAKNMEDDSNDSGKDPVSGEEEKQEQP